MNRNLNLPTILSFLSLWMILGNCYFNPAVQLVVNPEITKDNNPAAILGIASVLSGPRTVQITGQIVDANGIAVVGGTLTVLSRTIQLDGLSNTVPLNEGGRFYLVLSTGETSIRVDQSGVELFTFKFSIPTSGIVSVIEKSLTGPNVIGLEFYQIGLTPEYLDIVSVSPPENVPFTSWPTIITIVFSENLEIPSDNQIFLDTNVVTNPSISYDGGNSNINNNILQIYNSSSFSIGTNTYTFGSGIKSLTGKNLKTRMITYICNSPCNGS